MVRRYFKPQQLLTLYKAQVRSCVREYCSHLWDGSAKYQLEALESVEKQAKRFIGASTVAKRKLQSLEHRRKVFGVKGVLAPVFTPMNEDGSLKLDIIPDYADYLQKEQVNGILVAGTTGESMALSLRERKSLLAAWMEAAKPRGLRVVMHVGAQPLPHILELAQYSQSLGVDAILTLPELYFKPKTVEQLVLFLEAVAQAAPALPLLYYHNPMRSGVELNMKQLFPAATERIPTFKGMKVDFDVAMQLTDLVRGDQRVFIADHHLATSALMGYDSTMAIVCNICPRLVFDILNDMKSGNMETAKCKQEKMNRIVDGILTWGDFVPAMKAAMELVTGLKVGPTRMPVSGISEANKIKLKEQLKALKML